jgi:hypothetical protein
LRCSLSSGTGLFSLETDTRGGHFTLGRVALRQGGPAYPRSNVTHVGSTLLSFEVLSFVWDRPYSDQVALSRVGPSFALSRVGPAQSMRKGRSKRTPRASPPRVTPFSIPRTHLPQGHASARDHLRRLPTHHGLTCLNDMLPHAATSVVYRRTMVPLHRLVAERWSGGRHPRLSFSSNSPSRTVRGLRRKSFLMLTNSGNVGIRNDPEPQ